MPPNGQQGLTCERNKSFSKLFGKSMSMSVEGMVKCSSHPPFICVLSSGLSWRLSHSEQFLKGGLMSFQGWQWLCRLAKIDPTKTWCQHQVENSFHVVIAFQSPCSWSMASVEVHSYMIIGFHVGVNHNSGKNRKTALDTQRFKRIWELERKSVKLAKTQQFNTENQQSSTKYTKWGIRCQEETNFCSWSDVLCKNIYIILKW